MTANEKRYPCTHEGCNKSYDASWHLKRHVEKHHTQTCVEKMKCRIAECGKIFNSYHSLYKHFKAKHETTNQYKCTHCALIFPKHQQLKIHEYVHTNILPFKCSSEGCDKAFLLPSKLKRHLKIHDGYSCEENNCGQTFKTWSLLQHHKKKDHLTIYTCEECGKKFSCKTNFIQHQLTHSETRTVFHCPHKDCSKLYFHNKNLRQHYKAAHLEVKVTCPQENCSQTFMHKISLRKHLKTHEPGYVVPKNKIKKKSKVKKNATVSPLSTIEAQETKDPLIDNTSNETLSNKEADNMLVPPLVKEATLAVSIESQPITSENTLEATDVVIPSAFDYSSSIANETLATDCTKLLNLLCEPKKVRTRKINKVKVLSW